MAQFILISFEDRFPLEESKNIPRFWVFMRRESGAGIGTRISCGILSAWIVVWDCDLVRLCSEISTYISAVQCSSACGGEAGGGGHLALADRPAFHTDTNATWDTHFSSHCVEKERGGEGGGGRSDITARQHMVHGDTEPEYGLIEV